MRAAAAVVAVVLGAAACGPGKGVDPSQYAGLPAQDTLAGGLAPVPSTGTGGSAATPANPVAPPNSGGNALTWQSTPPAPATGAAAPAAGTAPAGAGGGAATGAGAGAGGTAQPPAGGHVPTRMGPAGVKR